MFSKIKIGCIVCRLALVLTIGFQGQLAWAQAAGATTSSGGPHRQLATIIYSGLGGAVLGLSTLSFYGQPQTKLANIALGFAFGIIAGTIYVTYQAAAHPNDFYAQTELPEQTLQIADQNRRGQIHDIAALGPLKYQWSF